MLGVRTLGDNHENWRMRTYQWFIGKIETLVLIRPSASQLDSERLFHTLNRDTLPFNQRTVSIDWLQLIKTSFRWTYHLHQSLTGSNFNGRLLISASVHWTNRGMIRTTPTSHDKRFQWRVTRNPCWIFFSEVRTDSSDDLKLDIKNK